ncbi:expressed unknown protein [Seminavis robusta]|uniref:Uncharacterized protein n=1 Tax=Seminavis robusta TaxID=568900 RepID=A0A9N8DNA6_9STRA|nr:expressed unknown protein [Seminavis robusta]|eukprot:Sro232_g093800.1 n/a (271) ;mRNA; f:21737-22549
MEDEFGDDSFFEEIADIDENGKVILKKENEEMIESGSNSGTVSGTSKRSTSSTTASSSGKVMKDEFGDYSFFEDIADIDENGKVILTQDQKTKDVPSKPSTKEQVAEKMEDEFGDYSFLADIEIDETGKVIESGADERTSVEQRTHLPVHGDHEEQQVASDAVPSSQVSLPRAPLQDNPEQGTTLHTREEATFWDAATWGSPRRYARKRSVESEAKQSPTSVLDNPYRRRVAGAKRRKNSSTSGTERQGDSQTAKSSGQLRKPERFIVYV